MQNNLNIVFMGTPDFALPSLEVLYGKYNISAVFCQPDKATGRGNKVKFGPVKQFAVDHGIPVYQPDTFKNNACLEILEKHNPDLIVVAAYGKILPKYVLDYPKYNCVNIHGSLLPKYRGASPIQSSVLNGDKETGITIMRMSEGLDTGDIITQKAISIREYETADELFDRMSFLGAECIVDAIDLIINGKATYTKQDESLSSHVTMITKEMGKLDFSKDSDSVINLIHGLNSWPSAYVNASCGAIKIHRAIKGNETNFDAGTVVSVSKLGIEVACGDGKTVIITELQKPGKKKTDAYAFTLGFKIEQGTSIYSI